MRLVAVTLFIFSVLLSSNVVHAENATELSAEMQVLGRFVGTWDMKVTAKSEDAGPATFDAVSYRSWSKGKHFLVFDDPGDEGLILTMTFNSASKSYSGVVMIGLKRGVVTAKWDAAKQTMSFDIDYPDGVKYRGVHRFVRKDYAEASGRVFDPNGTTVLELSWKQTRRDD